MPLDTSNNVIRYCKPSAIKRDGKITGLAFELRIKEDGKIEDNLSVDHFEYFSGTDSEIYDQIRKVIKSRLSTKAHAKLAKLNVANILTIRDHEYDIDVRRDPQKPLSSKCGIYFEFAHNVIISELLAERVDSSEMIG